MHRYTNSHSEQADLRFARTYFQNPLYAVLNLDGGLATSPATSGYINPVSATPTPAAGSSSLVSPMTSRSARSEEFQFSSPLRRHSLNTLPSRRTSFPVHSPTSPSVRSASGALSPSTGRPEGFAYRREATWTHAGATNGNFSRRSSGGSRSVSATSSTLDDRLMSSPTALATVDEESASHREHG